MLLFELTTEIFFFYFIAELFYCFVEVSEIFFFNSKKIMKSDMGIPCGYSRALWPLYKYP